MAVIPKDIKARIVEVFDEERNDQLVQFAIEDSTYFARLDHYRSTPGFVTRPPDHRSGYYD